MGEKKSKTNNKDNGSNKEAITVVLKVDFHCEGCASKLFKCIRNIDGVESVKCDDKDVNKLTVIGKVDPAKLRERVAQKTHKNVDLVSPLPKKDKDTNSKEKKEDKAKENKPKEPPVTTAVLKVDLHCQGCIQKIHKVITKTKGYHNIEMDYQKDLVTVKGSMDMKVLVESLKKHLKKDFQIIPPKKEGDKKEKSGGEKEKKKGGDGSSGGGETVEKMLPLQYQYGYQYPYPYVLEPGYGNPFHAPQLFSDENPNSCSIM